MNNEVKILNVLERMETKMDKLESNINMEFYAVRVEMDMVDKSQKKKLLC